MKLFKAATALQLIYLLSCLSVIVCMPLYSAFYGTILGDICFCLLLIFGLISLTPIGIIGTAINFFECFSTDLKKSKKILIWTIVSPLLIVSLWLLEMYLFISRTGGV